MEGNTKTCGYCKDGIKTIPLFYAELVFHIQKEDTLNSIQNLQSSISTETIMLKLSIRK